MKLKKGGVVGGGWWASASCVGRLAADHVDVFFRDFREVWGKFSSGTSLNKQCLSAYN